MYQLDLVAPDTKCFPSDTEYWIGLQKHIRYRVSQSFYVFLHSLRIVSFKITLHFYLFKTKPILIIEIKSFSPKKNKIFWNEDDDEIVAVDNCF